MSECHVGNPPITLSVPPGDSDKEPLSGGHFDHQKGDDVTMDRSVVPPFNAISVLERLKEPLITSNYKHGCQLSFTLILLSELNCCILKRVRSHHSVSGLIHSVAHDLISSQKWPQGLTEIQQMNQMQLKLHRGGSKGGGYSCSHRNTEGLLRQIRSQVVLVK